MSFNTKNKLGCYIENNKYIIEKDKNLGLINFLYTIVTNLKQIQITLII